MKKMLAVLITMGLVISMAGCGQNATANLNTNASASDMIDVSGLDVSDINLDNIDSISLMLGHVEPEDDTDPIQATAKTFAETLNQLSGGKIKVTVYPSAQLGDEKALVEGVQNGTIGAACVTNPVCANINTDAQLLDLPFLFENNEQARRVISGEAGQTILDGFSQYGVKALAYSENGFRWMLNNEKEIKSPQDLKGMKFRVMQSPVFLSFYDSIDVSAVSMAYGEVYTALSQKTIDGFDLTLQLLVPSKFYEVCKYMTDVRYSYTGIITMVNQAQWDSWTEDTQKLFVLAAKNAQQKSFELNDKTYDAFVQTLVDNGVTVTKFDEVEFEAFQQNSKSVWEEYTTTDAKKELLNSILALTETGE